MTAGKLIDPETFGKKFKSHAGLEQDSRAPHGWRLYLYGRSGLCESQRFNPLLIPQRSIIRPKLTLQCLGAHLGGC